MIVATGAALPLNELAAALRQGAADCVDIRSYAQRMQNFLPCGAYRDLFGGPSAHGAGRHELLCNIRQGDILDARHPDYVLVPIDFYAELVERTGLDPVFMGQLEVLPYMIAPARALPARPLPAEPRSGGRFRLCARLAISCLPSARSAGWRPGCRTLSTSTCRCWGCCTRCKPATDLLPLDDARYRFTLFPHHYAVPVGIFAAAHASIRGLWRAMPAERLRQVLSRAPSRGNAEDHFAALDEDFYLRRYEDIAAAIAGGHLPSGAHHYRHYGFGEGREPSRSTAPGIARPTRSPPSSWGRATRPMRPTTMWRSAERAATDERQIPRTRSLPPPDPTDQAQSETPKLLEGVRVLELARILVAVGGSVAGRFSAPTWSRSSGPGWATDTRGWGPPFMPAAGWRPSVGHVFSQPANRGKRSIAVDIDTPDGQAVVRRLAAHADVVIENFKVGGLARYGLDPTFVVGGDPRLVHLLDHRVRNRPGHMPPGPATISSCRAWGASCI